MSETGPERRARAVQVKHDNAVRDLEAVASHAQQQLALYRRRMYLGKGEPRRLAELEREAEGAAARVRRARADAG